MRDVKVVDIMVKPVVSARADTPARDAALQLIGGVYSGVPVTSDDGRVLGIVSELDILAAIVEDKNLKNVTAADIMTREPVTADVETPLSKVINLMKERSISRLPVTDKGKLVGIVARRDVMKSLIDPSLIIL